MTKPIYIGDKINLKIENLSQEEISQAFKDFHIDKVQDEKISFRTFKTGENIIDLGENQINLIVTSTITPDDKNIYSNLSDMSNTKVINPNFPFGFFIGASIFIISLIGTSCLLAMDLPKFSTAGFYELPNTGRKVYSTNLAWRFI